MFIIFLIIIIFNCEFIELTRIIFRNGLHIDNFYTIITLYNENLSLEKNYYLDPGHRPTRKENRRKKRSKKLLSRG